MMNADPRIDAPRVILAARDMIKSRRCGVALVNSGQDELGGNDGGWSDGKAAGEAMRSAAMCRTAAEQSLCLLLC